ncbi:hypothetical protein [Prosthecobacter sp.]|uniref:EF-hand domain-containing protein n=1 Tax=Prosthecobacter sp. TaxID=1965333 RepID=UPI001D8234BE|nr:hypothetical protein [Prosthecobacter sp.]MCB1279607.1 hypothetical protein [Prosthecobacter sp.]
MRTTPFRTLVLVAALLPAAAFAAKDAKRPKKSAAPHDGVAAEVLKTFDKNGDRQIDADELPALQKAFTALKSLDKNNNGEIELAEVEKPKPSAAGDRKERMLAGFQRIDKNGNHKIDADEVEGLQKMIAGGRIMSRLDQNGNGKLEPNEVEMLNSRLSQGFRVRPGASPSSSPSFRKPPEKKSEAAETPKPEDKKKEKPVTPEPGPKPPGNFGS